MDSKVLSPMTFWEWCLSQRHNKKVKAIHCCSSVLNNVGKTNRQSCGKDDEAHFPADFSRARTALTKERGLWNPKCLRWAGAENCFFWHFGKCGFSSLCQHLAQKAVISIVQGGISSLLQEICTCRKAGLEWCDPYSNKAIAGVSNYLYTYLLLTY